VTIVVDASVTMAWCFEDEATAESDELLERVATDGCLVPTLWRAEVANVLLVAERRGRLTAAQRDRFLSLLGRLPIAVEVADPDSAALVWLGERHGLSAYDAWYLWLAIRTGAVLATADQRLAAAATAAGVSTTL
jgi:predicted nucleic acid-binding protein